MGSGNELVDDSSPLGCDDISAFVGFVHKIGSFVMTEQEGKDMEKIPLVFGLQSMKIQALDGNGQPIGEEVEIGKMDDTDFVMGKWEEMHRRRARQKFEELKTEQLEEEMRREWWIGFWRHFWKMFWWSVMGCFVIWLITIIL